MITRSSTVSRTVSTASASYSRLQSLDVIRGVAIILVVLVHYPPASDSVQYEKPPPGICTHFYRFFHTFGWTGVDLFFVLSGFLIGSLLFGELQRTGEIKVSRFLGRRAFKIWPGYFALVVYAALRLVRHGMSARQILPLYWPNLLQIQNYATNNIVGPTWSLAVEEHFYLFLPICLALLSWCGRETVQRRFLPLAASMIVTISSFRIWHGLGKKAFNWRDDYSVTHLRLDSLLFGVLLAHVSLFRPGDWQYLKERWLSLLTIGMLLISPMMFLPIQRPFVFTLGFSLLYLGFGCILIAVLGMESSSGVGRRIVNSWGAKCLASIGVYSYAIYLWHMDLAIDPVLYHVRPILLRHLSPVSCFFGEQIACLTIAILVGIMMTVLIEKPFLALRGLLLPDRRIRSETGDASASTNSARATLMLVNNGH